MHTIRPIGFCFLWILWMANCSLWSFASHSSSSFKRQLRAQNDFGNSPLSDRQIIEQLLKNYRFPDPSVNISVGVSLFVERILEANEDLCNFQISITQKWLEEKLNYEHIRETPSSVRLRSMDYVWNPSLVIENALSVLPTGKSVINVFSNGIVEYVQRVQVLVQAETDLRNFPFEYRNCTFYFNNDDGRAVWSRLLGLETSQSVQKGVTEWKLVGTRLPEARAFQVLIRRSINQFVITLFLPTLGFVLMSFFSLCFYAAEDRLRLYANIASLIGIVIVVTVNQYKTPQTGFLKAIDIWCLALTSTVFLNCFCVIISGAWAKRVNQRRMRNSDELEKTTQRWIHMDTPYYAQLGIHPTYTICNCCCLSSLISIIPTLGFIGYIVYFMINIVFPYYQQNKS
ncbi:Gamma-aminobutyric acid receptor subunit pi [Aphelenchoides besseyi]|nr:Gamma-aminobutyric acid receptor subunit pi [Aphelenchoides besseyi]